jgi:hypothetical protein
LKRILINTSENSICICIECDDNFTHLQLIQILSINGRPPENAGLSPQMPPTLTARAAGSGRRRRPAQAGQG